MLAEGRVEVGAVSCRERRVAEKVGSVGTSSAAVDCERRALSKLKIEESCGSSQRVKEGPVHSSNQLRTGVLKISPSLRSHHRGREWAKAQALNVNWGLSYF